jgi:HSP20 family molecular chaperone IbpA
LGQPSPWARQAADWGFTRQVFLCDTMEADNISADYNAGVLTPTIPVHEQVAAS